MKQLVRCSPLVLALLGACEGLASERAPTEGASTATGARFEVHVDGQGYHPDRIEVPAGQPMTLVVTRTSDDGCGQQLVFPALGIRKDLPLDEPVAISLRPEAGEITFTCGMDMYRGAIVAR